ncbi:MAG: GFA family protein [Alphaproteobacteria bacterium]
MSDTQERHGQCLCGAVKITAKQASTSVGACHCNMCRQWAGGPYLAVDCGTDVRFEGEQHIGTFGSSDWAERGFCKTCGSNLFYRVKASGQLIVAAGLFEDQDGFVFDHQVFVDERPTYYDFANETEDKTGAELFAEFSGGD